MTYDVDVFDVQYLERSGGTLLARVHQPRGHGPFPLIMQVHGGAWCLHDRTENAIINGRLAAQGVVVAAVDFRMPPVATYPGSLADINYAVRWFKAQAVQFGSRSELVGVMGFSSGGHQAMLVAMRPWDLRYGSKSLPAGSSEVDASVPFAVLCYPAIDPLGRYRYAKAMVSAGQLGHEELPYSWSDICDYHERYWVTEESMAEGNPTLALERGEHVDLPAVLYIQGALDRYHPRPHLDRFITAYRKAGGQVDLRLIEGKVEGFMRSDPGSAASRDAISGIADFARAYAARRQDSQSAAH